MWARVTTIEVPAQRRNAIIARVGSHAAMVAARNQAGFRGAYWLAERSDGIVRAVEFFDTPESLRASSELVRLNAGEITASDGGYALDAQEYAVIAAIGAPGSVMAWFCRSLMWQEDPLHPARVIQRVEADVIPGVRQNPGFQGGFWLMDLQNGRCMGFTLWDTAERLELSGAVGRRMRQEEIERGQMQALELREYAIIARAVAREGE